MESSCNQQMQSMAKKAVPQDQQFGSKKLTLKGCMGEKSCHMILRMVLVNAWPDLSPR